MNTYGHTECSDDEVHWKIYEPPAEDEVRVPVGRPIGNLRTYVLDADLQPVPAGVTGGVYMGGVGVGRGYRGRPAQTAAAFLPDAFGGEPGARLYRTGDLGRWRPEGCLDYLGRGDSQVKLGGNRIELEEIEVALRRHDAVADAVVIIRAERLIAYVVERDDDDAPVEGRISARSADYAGFLRERLAETMVPAVFVSLPALPLNANGKTDRRALPEPDLSALAGEEREPATPTEARLARLWSELLGVAAVGMNDSFFALGGHSLVATRLFARMSQELGTSLPLALDLRSAVGASARATSRSTSRQRRPRAAGPAVRHEPAASGTAAAVVSAAGRVVPRAARGTQRDLQPRRRRPARGHARRVRAAPRARAPARSARGAPAAVQG